MSQGGVTVTPGPVYNAAAAGRRWPGRRGRQVGSLADWATEYCRAMGRAHKGHGNLCVSESDSCFMPEMRNLNPKRKSESQTRRTVCSTLLWQY